MRSQFQRLLRDRRGSAPLWAMFFIICFFMLAAVLYNAHAIYSNYYAVQDELTRCCAISLDANVVNSRLRDTITDVEYQPALDVLEQNLLEGGWTRDGGGWVKRADGRTLYRLTGMHMNVTGSRLHLTATANLPLPWAMAGQVMLNFPIDLYARILYIE
ncbi:MAG: hypothetical protein ACI4MF_05965 [Candidatus Faecivicinus sp.]